MEAVGGRGEYTDYGEIHKFTHKCAITEGYHSIFSNDMHMP